MEETVLQDSYNRVIDNIRISITDRCNFRCIYCMPRYPVWMPRPEILTFEEIKRLALIFISLGVKKIRLTGGEPTTRRDLPQLVAMLKSIPDLRDLSLTTNGYLLDRVGREIFDAGLKRINISMDTLKRERFKEITRTDYFDKVLCSIALAKKIGFNPLKVNAVIIRGYNDDEVSDFIVYAKEQGVEIRFIEFMPLDADNIWERKKLFTKKEILDKIQEKFEIESMNTDPRDPAKRYRLKDGSAIFGIISSISEPFCFTCNRVRLTADGKLRTCLFSITETDLKTPMRSGASDKEVRSIIEDRVFHKEPGHFVNSDQFKKPDRAMYSIGG